MKTIYRLLIILHVFVGVGAMGGGMAAILNPQNPMGVTVDALKNSPFDNYLVPGIILFTVIGLGNIIAAFVIYHKPWFHGYISSVFAWALVIWIVVQCIMLNTIEHLHIIFFIIGLIQASLAMIILFKHNMFPTNIIIHLYKKIFGE